MRPQLAIPFEDTRPCYRADDHDPTDEAQAPDVAELIRSGAIFYISHSGGKDSQAMYAKLRQLIPHAQIVVVHADLGRVEWEGVQDHIRDTIDHDLCVVSANKTLLGMVRKRHQAKPDVPAWPSPRYRQCTSDLKRGPIQRFIRQDMKARKATLGVNCMGLRAQESAARAKRSEWARCTTLSRAGRTVWQWQPIHSLSTREVFQTIRDAGQKPHWAYATGNERLSCVFCIMGSRNDLKNGRLNRPELYDEYLTIEQETGWTMFAGESLADRSH